VPRKVRKIATIHEMPEYIGARAIKHQERDTRILRNGLSSV